MLNYTNACVAPNDDNSKQAKFPVPTAMITILTVLAFTPSLVLSFSYGLLRDVTAAKMEEGLLDDDGTDSGSDFTRMSVRSDCRALL